MEILTIPVLSDNYIYLLLAGDRAAVVDPALAQPVLEKLAATNCKLVAIFNTHHHSDHIGGNRELLRYFPETIVYGGKEDRGRIPGQQVFLEDGDLVSFAGQNARIMFLPGHTRAHIAYYFFADQVGELFCGDVLFGGGCGRLFEGTSTQAIASLSRIRDLPNKTRIWCAHEYTLNNLKFALTVDGNNQQLRDRYLQVQQQRKAGLPTIPLILEVEKRTNPFLRWDHRALQLVTNNEEPSRVFTRLRGMKDLF
jgi:hydroxyacylglutathione hydrolase